MYYRNNFTFLVVILKFLITHLAILSDMVAVESATRGRNYSGQRNSHSKIRNVTSGSSDDTSPKSIVQSESTSFDSNYCILSEIFNKISALIYGFNDLWSSTSSIARRHKYADATADYNCPSGSLAIGIKNVREVSFNT